MSKAGALFEKARVHGLRANRDKRAIVHDDTMPKFIAKNGSRVRVTKGDLVGEDCKSTVGNAAGATGRIDGRPYVAVGGPNKGRLIQPVRSEDSSALMGVPLENLTPVEGGHSRAAVGYSPRYATEFDRIFGKK